MRNLLHKLDDLIWFIRAPIMRLTCDHHWVEDGKKLAHQPPTIHITTYSHCIKCGALEAREFRE